MIDRFVVVPASYLFLLRDDEVLLQLRQNTGFMDGHWAAAAAGHVERGETAYDAVRREAAESFYLLRQRAGGQWAPQPWEKPA